MEDIVSIPVERIKPHPLNPRCDFSHVKELAENIREHGGHPFNPILVRPLTSGYYQIICGHQRYKALKEELGRTKLEVGKDIIIKEMDDVTAIRIMVDDNIKQWKYKPAEFVEALKLLINTCGLSITKVAEQYGVSVSWLDEILKISKLPDRVKSKVEWGKGQVKEIISQGPREDKSVITVSHAKQLARLDNHNDQTKTALAVEKFGLTAEETKKVVDVIKQNPWTPIDDVVHIVRNQKVGPTAYSLVIEITDIRVADALKQAITSLNKTPEEYAYEKLLNGLVNDGYLSPEVLKQDEYRRWIEKELE